LGNDQPDLRALFACESGLSEPEIGMEHVSNGKIRTVPISPYAFAKTTAN
jgi:hypothetical protein